MFVITNNVLWFTAIGAGLSVGSGKDRGDS